MEVMSNAKNEVRFIEIRLEPRGVKHTTLVLKMFMHYFSSKTKTTELEY